MKSIVTQIFLHSNFVLYCFLKMRIYQLASNIPLMSDSFKAAAEKIKILQPNLRGIFLQTTAYHLLFQPYTIQC